MKSQGGLIILLLLAGAVVYSAMKKPIRRGSVIVDPLGPGEFITDPAQLLTDEEKAMFEI
jgi:hypothetical protein